MGSSGEKSAKKQKREKTPGKSASKKRDRDPETPADDATNAEEKMNPVCAIAKPLADAKLTKKLLKVVKKASKFKQVRRGVKEVVKELKSTKDGLCVIAGDISPIDVITHVPILCEDAGVQYIFVHSKEQLGAAGMTKRPTSVMLVLPKAIKGSQKMGKDDEKEFDEMYKSVFSKVKSMHDK